MELRKNPEQVLGLLDVIEYIGLFNNHEMVEVGCYRGESTEIWATYGCTVYAVDSWKRGIFNLVPPKDLIRSVVNAVKMGYVSLNDLLSVNKGVEKDFDNRCKDLNNIIKIKEDSVTASNTLSHKRFDFVYLDALHDYKSVMTDIKSWRNLVKPGGYIGGHDYCEGWPDVIKAVDETFGAPDKTFMDTSWVVQL